MMDLMNSNDCQQLATDVIHHFKIPNNNTNMDTFTQFFQQMDDWNSIYIEEWKSTHWISLYPKNIQIWLYNRYPFTTLFDLLVHNPTLYIEFIKQIEDFDREYLKRSSKLAQHIIDSLKTSNYVVCNLF